MKPHSPKHAVLLLLSIFALSTTPVVATTSALPVNPESAAFSNTISNDFEHTATKQTKKQGFFSKLKKIGQKAKMFVKAVAGGEHNAVVAILLAFFLGGLGIHRVYLGGRPLLILLYIITFGGIFGLLPLIDFIRLIIGHMSHYEGNDKFFAAFSSK